MRRFSRWVLASGLTTSFFYQSLNALETRERIVTSRLSHRSLENKNQPTNLTKLHLWQESAQYLAPLPGTKLMATHSVILSGQWKTERRGLDFISGLQTNLGSSFFYLNELYASLPLGKDLNLFIGRKKFDWSEFDREWDLGLWQPIGNWDPLRPFEQGLTGFFIKHQYKKFESLLYLSPLFVPTASPEIQEKNGSLVSDSRWHRTPVTSGLVLDRETQFYYSLDIPELAQLANQTSLGLKLQLGKSEPGFWTSLAIARKPINSLTVKYDYNLAVTPQNSRAEIRVVPTVSYHELSSLEAGWQNNTTRITVSGFQDQVTTPLPNNKIDSQGQNQTDWLQQSPQNLRGLALKLEQALFIKPIRNSVHFSLSYLNIETPSVVDKDDQGFVRGSLFPDRFNWSRALQAHLSVPLRAFKKPWNIQFRWMREINQKGSLYSVYHNLEFSKNLNAHLSFDILGADDGSLSNLSPSFFNQFRTNDRVFGGLSYVF